MIGNLRSVYFCLIAHNISWLYNRLRAKFDSLAERFFGRTDASSIRPINLRTVPKQAFFFAEMMSGCGLTFSTQRKIWRQMASLTVRLEKKTNFTPSNAVVRSSDGLRHWGLSRSIGFGANSILKVIRNEKVERLLIALSFIQWLFRSNSCNFNRHTNESISMYRVRVRIVDMLSKASTIISVVKSFTQEKMFKSSMGNLTVVPRSAGLGARLSIWIKLFCSLQTYCIFGVAGIVNCILIIVAQSNSRRSWWAVMCGSLWLSSNEELLKKLPRPASKSPGGQRTDVCFILLCMFFFRARDVSSMSVRVHRSPVIGASASLSLQNMPHEHYTRKWPPFV